MAFKTSDQENKAIYSQGLKTISGVNFTYREIDVIACLVNQRAEKKVAAILSVSPKTVNAHVRNIMIKLSCNSKEDIIDFIENSGKILLIRRYYSNLLILNSFLLKLKKIAQVINRKNINCSII
ncbi:MAG: helix-turn-helix transcriptional regulator [Rickettsiaceae bacterium]|nr:helix-turn-helix transcriptional regulator [Rickettsiaceae bacterium]